MCRCSLSCDYIYQRLEYSERMEAGTVYQLSPSLLFPEEEINDTKTPEEDPVSPSIIQTGGI